MRLLTTFGLTLILFCRFAGSSGAAECPTISGTHTKPQLSGHIADDSRALGLIWRSGADQDSQTREWKLNYGVCNDGASPLVVDWPKAGLSNDAYTPLLPGDSIRSEFPVGVDDPVVDGALLRYGKYTSAEAQTRIYQSAQNGSKKEAKLESRFGRRFALLTGSVNAARPTSASIEGFVTASPDFKKGGYTLTAFCQDIGAAENIICNRV